MTQPLRVVLPRDEVPESESEDFGGEECPDVPPDLGKEGQEFWLRNAPILYAAGALLPQDLDTFKELCILYDEVHRLKGIVQKDGEYHVNSQGTYSAHPALNHLKELERRKIQLFSQFGMSPVGRKDIKLKTASTQSAQTRPR